MDISIIIVNYNLSKEVDQCLQSIIHNVHDVNYEVIIVDNFSPDKNQLKLELKYSDKDNFHFFYLNENVGFGSANNYGFTHSKGEIICFLNPDTILIENFFNSFMKLFKENPSIGILGPGIINNNRKLEKSFGYYPNILSELLNLFFLQNFLEMFWMKKKLKNGNNCLIDVDWVTGAALIIRRELFSTIKGFDPKFFMYNEEIDLCKRANENGSLIKYFSQNKLIHLGGASSKKNYFLFTMTSYESKLYYINKHFNKPKKLFLRVIVLCQIILQSIIWLFLFPLFRQKASEKLRAFPKLIFQYLSK